MVAQPFNHLGLIRGNYDSSSLESGPTGNHHCCRQSVYEPMTTLRRAVLRL